jgi:N,N'-diacetyllegionaminate synthase
VATNIIAEFCQNHNGNVEVLNRMILEAKLGGASHAKIQGLYSSELTKRPEFELENQAEGSLFRPYQTEFDRLSKLDLTLETESHFVLECKRAGIIPMITVFTHLGLERALMAGFNSFKIASYDCGSRELISRILPHADELVISTGATLWNEIELTSQLVAKEKKSHTRIAFLHARTIYPTPLDKMNISRMLFLRYLGWDTGLSDHSRPEVDGLIASKLAIHLGANYIERHFTVLARNETKDGPVSILPNELQELYKFSQRDSLARYRELSEIDNLARICLGNGELEIDSQEVTNAKYYRGRVASWRNSKQIYSWESWTEQ